MKSATSELVDDFLDLVGVAHAAPFVLMRSSWMVPSPSGADERLVDAPVLLDERQAVERRRGDDHLEVVAAAGAVDHVELGRVRERALEQLAQRLRAHASIVASEPSRLELRLLRADVAELVDAHGSGPCARKGVEVQVLSSAL